LTLEYNTISDYFNSLFNTEGFKFIWGYFMEIGAHVSTAGGLYKSIQRAESIGATAIQIFASSPRGWRFKPFLEQDVDKFSSFRRESNVSTVVCHGIYLVNLGGKEELLEKSIQSLIEHLTAAHQIGAKGVVFHSGSHKGVGFEQIFSQATKAIKTVLESSPVDTELIIENCAGMGAQIGASFEEIGAMISEVSDERLKCCIDLQHAFAAGYDIGNSDSIDQVIEDFDSHIGLNRLSVIHANDSKVPFASGVDRHENIGDGHIGIEGFKTIVNHPSLKNIPFILEVPGFDGKGPDKRNIDILNGLILHE